MKVVISNEQTQFQTWVYKESFWTGSKSLYIGDVPCAKLNRNTFLVHTSDGREVHFVAQGNLFSGVKLTSMEFGDIVVARPLVWYEYILAFLPLLLIILGGLIGAVFGVISCGVNLAISRSEMNPVMKIVTSLFSILIATVLWLVFASIVLTALNVAAVIY